MAKPRLTTGSTIDGFVVGEAIHTGGMAMIWEVTHSDIDVPLVMKVPLLFEGEDPSAIVGFEMEQMILPRLSGPHIPKFFASGDFTDQPYIVMEHIGGESLMPLLDHLPRSYEETVYIAARVATAIDDIHRQHVIHLDIKPSNILSRPSGEIVLIDFGLAHHNRLPDLMDEEFRVPYGTAPYMAPEQILGIRRDPRSDIFALGVLIYFLSTGKRPFGESQTLKGMKRRLWKEPTPPRAIRPDYPPELQEIVLHCLEVNPAERYPTAAQVGFDLINQSQVKLTARAAKTKPASFWSTLKKKFDQNNIELLRQSSVITQIAAAPIIMVAIDLGDSTNELSEALQRQVLQTLVAIPDARVACVNVLKLNRVAIDRTLDESGNNKHVDRLARLKGWARSLNLPEDKMTYHVLEAIDPAQALLDFADSNHVDHIVMGARANSTSRKMLGSVSAVVASRAPSTVTVVRSRDPVSSRIR
ncbi:MAG: protein kinase [Afipia sp.]|nr:protein kinase [Afipia sp.]